MRKRSLIPSFVLALPLVNLLFYRLLRGPAPRPVQIVAHRGGAALALENSEAAFRNAARIHADWIEFDVHRTADGVLVVMHDDTVNRVTNGKGYIKDLTWPQIHQLRMRNGELVMTFAEVVTLAREMGIGIMPELKSMQYYPGMEVEALEIVRRADYVAKTIFLSFDWDALTHIKSLEPALRVAPLYNFSWDVRHPRPANAEIVAPMAEMITLNPWLIRQAHADGRQVWVWFGLLDGPALYRLMIFLGVDAIICNDPVTARKIVASHPRH